MMYKHLVDLQENSSPEAKHNPFRALVLCPTVYDPGSGVRSHVYLLRPNRNTQDS